MPGKESPHKDYNLDTAETVHILGLGKAAPAMALVLLAMLGGWSYRGLLSPKQAHARL